MRSSKLGRIGPPLNESEPAGPLESRRSHRNNRVTFPFFFLLPPKPPPVSRFHRTRAAIQKVRNATDPNPPRENHGLKQTAPYKASSPFDFRLRPRRTHTAPSSPRTPRLRRRQVGCRPSEAVAEAAAAAAGAGGQGRTPSPRTSRTPPRYSTRHSTC